MRYFATEEQYLTDKSASSQKKKNLVQKPTFFKPFGRMATASGDNVNFLT